jgi:hypothetical protein
LSKGDSQTRKGASFTFLYFTMLHFGELVDATISMHTKERTSITAERTRAVYMMGIVILVGYQSINQK